MDSDVRLPLTPSFDLIKECNVDVGIGCCATTPTGVCWRRTGVASAPDLDIPRAGGVRETRDSLMDRLFGGLFVGTLEIRDAIPEDQTRTRIAVKVAHFPNQIDKSVGSRLREKRTACGLSERELAERLQVDVEDICLFEQGLKRINARQLLLITQILAVTPGYFFGVVDQRRPISGANAKDRIREEKAVYPSLPEQGLRLQRAFFKINSSALRQSIVNLVTEMASTYRVN